MRELSTPHSAYRFLREIGLNHRQAVALTASRDRFEYFVEALGLQ